MCKYWCWNYTKCPHLGEFIKMSTCLHMEILEAKGYTENDVNMRYLRKCIEELEVEKRVTYGACDSCLRDVLARQTKVRKAKGKNNKRKARADEIVRRLLERLIRTEGR